MKTQAEIDLEKALGDRLIALAGGKSGLRTQTGNIHAAFDPKDQDVMTIIASDDTLDRYNEIIAAEGWDLTDYQKNPVIQANHDYSIESTIGRAEKTWVDGKALKQQWRFASAMSPLALYARDMFRAKFLNACSVGFIPVKYENGTDAAGFRRKYIAQELIEVSAVAVPANPNALADAVKSGAVAGSTMKELAKFLKHFCNETAEPGSKASASAAGIHDAQLVQLACDLGAVMRGI